MGGLDTTEALRGAEPRPEPASSGAAGAERGACPTTGGAESVTKPSLEDSTEALLSWLGS